GTHGGRLLEHGDRRLADRLARHAARDLVVVARDQLREVDRARQPGGAGADELHVEIENFPVHWFLRDQPAALAAVTWDACASASSQRSASIAAMQPVPAAVTAWR